MKKKKQKHRLKEIEKRSSEKGMDLMEAYTEKPVQEEVYSCCEKNIFSCLQLLISTQSSCRLSNFLKKKIFKFLQTGIPPLDKLCPENKDKF